MNLLLFCSPFVPWGTPLPLCSPFVPVHGTFTFCSFTTHLFTFCFPGPGLFFFVLGLFHEQRRTEEQKVNIEKNKQGTKRERSRSVLFDVL
jgi:hypothetical protein